jgi:Family of unknown function (DUF6328)
VGEESKEERLDRELIELLNELRVVLPGVQVLFAFLLIVPFSQLFDQVTDFQKSAYLFVLLSTAAGSSLLMAPTSYHRLHFRQHNKEQIVLTSHRLAVAGTALLAVSITGSVFLVADVVFDLTTAVVTTSVTAVFLGWFWYGLPLLRRRG